MQSRFSKAAAAFLDSEQSYVNNNSVDNLRDGACKRNRLFRCGEESESEYMQNSSNVQPSQPQGIMEADDSLVFVDFKDSVRNSNNNNSNQGSGQLFPCDTSQRGLIVQNQKHILPPPATTTAAMKMISSTSIGNPPSICSSQETSQLPIPRVQLKPLMNSKVSQSFAPPTSTMPEAAELPQQLKQQSVTTNPQSERGSTSFDIFSMLFHLNRFLFKFKRILIFFRPHLLNALQLQLIGDKSAQTFESDGFGVPYPVSESHLIRRGSALEEQLNEQLQHNKQQMGISTPITGMNKYILNSTANFEAIQRRKQRKLAKLKWKQYSRIFKRILCGVSLSRLKRESLQFMRRVLRKTIDRIPIIDPQSKLFQLWQALLFACDILNIIYIPFRHSFSLIPFLEDYVYHVTLPVIYAVSILVNCNAGIYDRGVLMESRKKIITAYFRQQFFIDAISILAHFTIDGLLIVRFLTWDRHTFIDSVRAYFLRNQKLYAASQFLSLVLTILLFAHFFSCIWHSLGLFYLSDDQGWIYSFNFTDQNTTSRYITCFYYAVVSMTTTGYGDIFARTTGERLFMVFAVFIACGLYGYTLNSIGSILSNLKKKNERSRKKLAQLEEYLSLHSVDVSLRNKARKYVQYVFEQENMLKRDAQESLTMLNAFLKEEIQTDIKQRVLQHAHSLLSALSSNQKFFARVASVLSERIFGPEELIHDSGSSPALHIISYGEVELFVKRKDTKAATVMKHISQCGVGSVFGKDEFFTNNQIAYLTARSVGVTYVSSIALEDFQEILADFPLERERYYHMRDQVNFNVSSSTNSMTGISCVSCQSDSHPLNRCPYLFYDQESNNTYERKIRVVASMKAREKQRISSELVERKLLKGNNSLKEIGHIASKIRGFQQQYQDEIYAVVEEIRMFYSEDQDFYEAGTLVEFDGVDDEDQQQQSSQMQNRKRTSSKPAATTGTGEIIIPDSPKDLPPIMLNPRANSGSKLRINASFHTADEYTPRPRKSTQQQQNNKHITFQQMKSSMSRLDVANTTNLINNFDDDQLMQQQLQNDSFMYAEDRKEVEKFHKRKQSKKSLTNIVLPSHQHIDTLSRRDKKHIKVPISPSHVYQATHQFPVNPILRKQLSTQWNASALHQMPSLINAPTVSATMLPRISSANQLTQFQQYQSLQQQQQQQYQQQYLMQLQEYHPGHYFRQQSKDIRVGLGMLGPFDKMKSFKVYFPENNYDAIIARWNERLRPKMMIKKSTRRFNNKPPPTISNSRYSTHNRLSGAAVATKVHKDAFKIHQAAGGTREQGNNQEQLVKR